MPYYHLIILSLLNRYQPIMHGQPGGSQVNRYLSRVYYVGSQIAEVSPWYNLEGKLGRIFKAFKDFKISSNDAVISTNTTAKIYLPNNSIDYIFTDPPFGENIYYAPSERLSIGTVGAGGTKVA